MCMICKKEAKMEGIDFSNDIRINEWYDCSDNLEYCTYCGTVFLISHKLGKHKERELSDE